MIPGMAKWRGKDVDDSWMEEAACKGRDTEEFFPYHQESEKARSNARRAAKDICMGCPVREECLSYALVLNEDHGIWGGLTDKERRSLRRKFNQRGVDHSDFIKVLGAVCETV